MSNVAVIGGSPEKLGDFFRKLAVRADLGEYVYASVACVTQDLHVHTAWHGGNDMQSTNALVCATTILQRQITDNAIQS